MLKVKLVLLSLFILPLLLCANPIDDTPVAKFSELVFDDKDKWIMEIVFPYTTNSYIDSIVFKTSSLEATYSKKLTDNTYIYIIASDSLSIPLNINRQGDKINIYTYSNLHTNIVREDSITFGNLPGATVKAPVEGYSITRIENKIYPSHNIDLLTKKHSLGFVNSREGLSGALTGYLYDKNNELINRYDYYTGIKNYFFLEDTLFLNTDGSFTTRIYNTIFKQGGLYVMIANYFTSYLEIEPFELENITPDTVINHDIHIISDCDSCKTVTGIEDEITLPNEEVLLINYPNPFNLLTNFYVKIPDGLRNKEKVISIYNAAGELIRKIWLNEGKTIQWNGTDSNGRVMTSGVYYYQLNIDNRSLKSGSMVLLK